MKAIPYGRQCISQEDIESVIAVLKSEYLTQGPVIKEFEDDFARYVGAKHAVAVSNGTAALHLSALALNVNNASNVITTPITFAASANCIKYCGGNVYFVDINPETWVMDIDKLEKLILSKPPNFFSGVIPVDFAGYAVNTEKIKQLAEKHNMWIIEDACHAPGAYFLNANNEKVFCGSGKYSDLTIFSFHPVKHITSGEGGMITTNNDDLYKKLILLRSHGITKQSKDLYENHGGWYYEMQTLGFNYRLTDLQAALGKSQLKRADDGLQRRREIAAKYHHAFKNNSKIIKQSVLEDGHAFHLYVIQVVERKNLFDFLRTKAIYCQIHYIPVHLQPYYKLMGYKKNDFPIAEAYYETCISLPMFPTLTSDEQALVIQLITEYINGS